MNRQEQEELAEAHQQACDDAERLYKFVPRHERGSARGKSAEYRAWSKAAKHARDTRAAFRK